MLRTEALEKKINEFMQLIKEEKGLNGWKIEVNHSKNEQIYWNNGIVVFLDTETEEESKGRVLEIEIIITAVKINNKFDFRKKIELIEETFDKITEDDFRVEKKVLNYAEYEDKTKTFIDTASIIMTLDISSITNCYDDKY